MKLRLLLVAVALGVCMTSQGDTAPAAAFQDGRQDWPHWRGPERNDITSEHSGYGRGQWPGELVWTANVGQGATSPVVVDGRLYVMGSDGSSDHVQCLDAASGEELWRQSYPCPLYGRNATGDEGLYSGPTSTPEFDGQTGFLYTLSIDGHLNCWDTRRSGRRLWGRSLYDDYGMPPRPTVGRSSRRDYGYTTSPLVHEDWLIVEVGAPSGNLMAFDKRSGEPVWASQSTDLAGHTGGPVPITVEAVPCVCVLTFSNLLVARLDAGHEGETVAEYPWQTEWANSIATPAVHENNVLITSGYNHDSICRLAITLSAARRVWEQPFHSKTCSPVVHNGHIYWAWHQIRCHDFATGEPVWEGPFIGDAGSCIVTGDDRLIVWGLRGELILAETANRSPHRYTELARRGNVFRTDVWPHVVLAGGRIFCKDRDGNLACFALP